MAIQFPEMSQSLFLWASSFGSILLVILFIASIAGIFMFLRWKGYFAKYPYLVIIRRVYGQAPNITTQISFDKARFTKDPDGKMYFQFKKMKNFEPTLDQSYFNTTDKGEKVIELTYLNNNEYYPTTFDGTNLKPQISGDIINITVDRQTKNVLRFQKTGSLEKWYPLIAVIFIGFIITIMYFVLGGQLLETAKMIASSNAQALEVMQAVENLRNVQVGTAPPF